MQPPVRVLIVTENDADLRKLSRVFEQFPGFTATGVKVSARFVGTKPGSFDVCVVQARDLTLVATALPAVPTVYLVPHASTGFKALSGPNAILPSYAASAQITAAAMALAAGLQITRSTDAATPPYTESDFAVVEALTDRELHILNLVADGLSNPEIARRLGISRNTVKFHVSSIIAKLGATSRTEAVTLGVKRGLIIV